MTVIKVSKVDTEAKVFTVSSTMSIRDDQNRVSIQVDTRLGPLRLEWIDDAITRLEWIVPSTGMTSGTPLPQPLDETTFRQSRLVEDLIDYADGKYISFRAIPVAFHIGTHFQKRIWRACQQIPYGARVTYGQLAEMAGHPGAARAVGRAMSQNQIPLIIPCHRVVAAGNKLGGFTSPQGITLKKRLLQMEQTICHHAQKSRTDLFQHN